jgi:hypothetical protein
LCTGAGVLRVAIQNCSKDVLSKFYRSIHASDTFYEALVYFSAATLFSYCCHDDNKNACKQKAVTKVRLKLFLDLVTINETTTGALVTLKAVSLQIATLIYTFICTFVKWIISIHTADGSTKRV